MKINKIFAAIATAFILGAYSCTDEWSEHYAVQMNGEGTVWEVLNAKPELSNFRDVIEATDYLNTLNSSQVFTVFAPTNDKFTEADRDAVIALYKAEQEKGHKLSKNLAIKEFVMNHIALYNYSTSKDFKDTDITMLNGKKMTLSKGAFGDVDILESNIHTGNGVLFTIDGETKYNTNIFEYIEKDADLDSVAKFYYMNKKNRRFYVETFMPSLSVPGEIIDGQQHYLDSVVSSHNVILENHLGAYLNNEDSTYYVLLPSNEAWKKQYERNVEMFQYDKTVDKRDSLMYFYPHYLIANGGNFSLSWNKNIADHSVDSVQSTIARSYTQRREIYGWNDYKHYVYDKPYAAGGIFEGAREVECSNGNILISNNWNLKRRQTFLTNIVREAETTYADDSLSGTTQVAKPYWELKNVDVDNPYYNKVGHNKFRRMWTSTASLAPEVLLVIPNVLSNVEYDVYVTTVPAEAGDTLVTADDLLPARFISTLYWHDMDGKEESRVITPDDGGEIVVENRRNYAKVNPNIVQNIHLGTFTFPTCSFDIEPQVKLRLQVNGQRNQWASGLRIDKITFVPRVDE